MTESLPRAYSPDVGERGFTELGTSLRLSLGARRFSALVDIPAGGERTVTFELEGTMDLADGYHLDVVPQPLVNNDRFRVTVRGPSGQVWGGSSPGTKELTEDAEVEVELPPADWDVLPIAAMSERLWTRGDPLGILPFFRSVGTA